MSMLGLGFEWKVELHPENRFNIGNLTLTAYPPPPYRGTPKPESMRKCFVPALIMAVNSFHLFGILEAR